MKDWEHIFNIQGKVFLQPQEDMNKIISIMRGKRVKKVLDLGCGSGRHTVLLAKEGFEVHATDISKKGLGLTKKWLNKNNKNADLKEASCYERFPYNDNYFDAVITIQVIHHNYHDKIKYCISEIERVLKLGGVLFVTVSANKYKRGATRFKKPEPHTYIPLDGEEEGLPHFIYTKDLLKEDFKNFKILDLHKDSREHFCLLGTKR